MVSDPNSNVNYLSSWNIVSGSKFAVDAFRYGEISHVEDYFLTHYHADHYIGLTKKFCHTIYLSEITAILVKAFIGVDEKYLKIVKVNEPFYLEEVQITPMDVSLFIQQFNVPDIFKNTFLGKPLSWCTVVFIPISRWTKRSSHR